LTKHKWYNYELTDVSKLQFFSDILDDFEEYIKAYWEKSQHIKWDDVPVLPESFRIEYIDKQFDADFEVEDEKRNNEEEGAGEVWIDWTDIYYVKNTPENLKLVNDTGMYSDVQECNEETFIVETCGLWYKHFFNPHSYEEQELGNFLCATGLSKEDVK